MLKQYKPTTQGRRKMSVVDYSILTRQTPEKSLIMPKKKRAGRDKTGQISVRHQGGGAKQKYRRLSDLAKKIDQEAKVEQIEYDPFRTSFVALVKFEDQQKRYLLAWEGIKVGDKVTASEKTEIRPGNRARLTNIPNGIIIHDIELKAGQGGKLCRSAGSGTTIVAKEGDYVHLKLPSGEIPPVF